MASSEDTDSRDQSLSSRGDDLSGMAGSPGLPRKRPAPERSTQTQKKLRVGQADANRTNAGGVAQTESEDGGKDSSFKQPPPHNVNNEKEASDPNIETTADGATYQSRPVPGGKTNVTGAKRKRPQAPGAGHDPINDTSLIGKSPTDHRPLKSKQKKVSFSNHVEVCGAEEMKEKDTSLDRRNDAGMANACDGDDLIWGRFSKEEDEIIRDSVARYIKERGLDEEEGLTMVLNCRNFPKFRNCWKEIADNLPWRAHHSVYIRAHVLYEQSGERSWTKDEIEFVKSFQAEHGNRWSKLANILGKSRYHVKDKWRGIRRGVMNQGNMSQEEYQRLFDLVNYNLRLKASQMEEKPTRRKVRQNINWEAIADKMETRDHAFCCRKWYSSLTSSMVESGEWHDGDDCILLRRLLETNAFGEEAVEWDDLLEDRIE